MSATRLYQFLTAKPTRTQLWLWLGLSLLVSLIYSVPAMQTAWSSGYVIQDDARQHVFWMRRFLDPDLFPQDLMADYFQSVAPWGYASLYRLFAWFGIDPVGLSQVLPVILGLVTTGFCFSVAMQILPLPTAGFAAATLLNQNLWMRDDLSSATPGAFFYPIFLAFLYYLLRHSLIPCVITIALQGLFYPQAVFLSAGILLLRLLDWSDLTKPRLNRSQIRFGLIGLAVAFVVMLLYAFKSSEFGPVIRVAAARSLPAFAPTGWSAYFSDNFVQFWLCGKRSGMIPTEWCDLAKDQQDMARLWLLGRFPSLWLGLLFPVVLVARHRLPLAQRLTDHWQVLWQTLFVSVGLFLLAHMLAFRLHLPNRYTEHSFRILLALAAGITLVILWDKLFQWCLHQKPILATSLTVLLAATLVFYPYQLEIDHEPFPITGFVKGDAPSLYRFFANQPKDTVIASLSEEANQIPTFSQRSLLAGGEGYLLPYHPQYYQQLSQKLLDTMQAQYSSDLSQVKAFINRYSVDFWLLDQASFQPDFNNPKSYLTQLFAQFPDETQPIKARLAAGMVPALSQIPASCSVQRDGFQVLRARCILRQERIADEVY